jgi:hypothetical protein
MLENLLKLVKENAGEAIINNPAIPNEKNDAAIEVATNALFKGLQKAAGGSGVGTLQNLFQNESNVASSPVVKKLSSSVSGELMKKFGLNKGVASGIVAMLIPIVMSKLVQKTNDPADNSFNLDGILGSLLGNQAKAGGLLDILKKLTGK